MNNKKTRNRLFTLLLLVMAWLIPQWGWAQTASQPQEGNGDPNNPYIITKAEELAWFRDQVNSGNNTICAKIADGVEVIDLKDFCHKADATKNLKEVSWEPIGIFQKPYRGTFDGNGMTIKNLYIKASKDDLGFFGYISQSTIKNLTFEDADVTNTPTIIFANFKKPNTNTGILVAQAVDGSILQGIKISNSCQMNGGKQTGGIAGSFDGNASNCVNYATVYGYSDVGGLFGYYKGNSITTCANYGTITATRQYAGGLVSNFVSGTIQDCANYGYVEGAECVAGMAGRADGDKIKKIQNVFCYGNIKANNNKANIGMVLGSSKNVTTEGMVAYYSGAKLTVGGQGQKAKAFGSTNLSEDKATGYTAAQLKSGEVAYLLQQNASSEAKWGQNLANGGDIYPVIGSDYKVYIDNLTLQCKTNEVLEYSSTYNNTGSVIIYQHINNADGYCSRCQPYGVKPSLENGVYLIAEPCHLAWFRNYVNGTIVGEGEVAGTARLSASARLTANINLKGYCYAADASQNLKELSWVPIGNNANQYKGTFDGNGNTISNLYINATQENMGLFGYTDQSTIKNLTLENADVTNTADYTGFLVGRAKNGSTFQNIKISNTDQVTEEPQMAGKSYTGGIAGSLNGDAYNCVNYATVDGKGYDVGGLFGYYEGKFITACANYGKVTANSMDVGGLVGYFQSGTIQDCASYGNVEGTERVGGMAGLVAAGKIQNVFCYGNIKAKKNTSYIGMAFGYSNKATTEGMVAYYSGATLTVNNGQEIAVKAFGNSNLSEDNATGFTAYQLESGVVTFLLQENASSKAIWGQNLMMDRDIYPVIGSQNLVFPFSVTLKCKTYEVVKGSFSNDVPSSYVIKYQHGQIDHHAATVTCTEAGTKEYWQCQDCKRTYSDEQLTKELTDVTMSALGHIYNEDGFCSRCQPCVVEKPSQVDGVYQIEKPCHLAWFRDYVNGTIVDDGDAAGTAHLSASAILIANIDLKNYCHAADTSKIIKELSWEPIGYLNNFYKGVFDGNGKTISHLYINANQLYVGLFGYTRESTIKGVTFEYADVTNASYDTGFLVGDAGYRSTLQNIKISKTCQMNGSGYTGSIAGVLDGDASNCVNYAAVHGKDGVGGLFGNYSRTGNSMTACANYGDVTATDEQAGGLVGYFGSGTIQDCANYGNVEGTYRVAGIAGLVDQGKMQNVFNYGNVRATTSTLYIGMAWGDSRNATAEGMVAYYSGAKLTVNGQEQAVKAFGDSKLSEDNATGFTEIELKSGKVAWLLQQKASSDAKWGQNLGQDGDIYPIIGSEHQVYADNVTLQCKTNEVVECSPTFNNSSSVIKYQHINDEDGYCSRCQHYVAVEPSLVNGVYQIAKPYHLAWFRDYVNGTIVGKGEAAGTAHPSVSAILTDNINLKNYCHAADKTQSLNELSWDPIGTERNPYKGIFDGNGKTISYLYINATQENMGLFGKTYQSTIKNLTLENADVTNTANYTGILVGYAETGSILQGIKISNSCQIQVENGLFTGGIAGIFEGNAYNCVNYAEVQGNSYVAGLFGYSYGNAVSIVVCANYGTVTATSSYVGGLVGYLDGGIIINCANYGYVEGKDYVAGMAGLVIEGRIKNVFCYGNIKATEDTPKVGMAWGYTHYGVTEGMVAYYSGATLTVKDQLKDVRAFGGDKIPEDRAKGYTMRQIASGEVAWLLNGSTSEGRTLAWYQKLGKDGDKYPVLTRTDGNTVYRNECTCVGKPGKIYSNTENTETEVFDQHDKSMETPSGDGLYSTTCQRCQTPLLYIKDFCGIDGNDLDLTADAEGNYKAETVMLTDKDAYNSPVDFTAGEVGYTRNNPHAAWQVYYVPFDIDSRVLTEAGITAAYINNFHEYTKDGETEVVLEVKEVTSGTLKANVPYVMKADQVGETLIHANDVTLHRAASNKINCQSVTHDYTFTGIYEAKSEFNQYENVSNGIIDYTLKEGLFYELSQTATLSPMRWYLTISNRNKATETSPDQPARVRSVTIKVVGEGEATGMENIHVITEGNAYVNQGIYDLHGRRLSAEPAHGVYIKNGKKIIK